MSDHEDRASNFGKSTITPKEYAEITGKRLPDHIYRNMKGRAGELVEVGIEGIEHEDGVKRLSMLCTWEVKPRAEKWLQRITRAHGWYGAPYTDEQSDQKRVARGY